MNPVRGLIASMGGPAEMARRLSALTGEEVSTQAVWAWGKAGSVPRWWMAWVARLAAAEGRPLSTDDVIALGGRPRASRGHAA